MEASKQASKNLPNWEYIKDLSDVQAFHVDGILS